MHVNMRRMYIAGLFHKFIVDNMIIDFPEISCPF